MRYAKFLVFVFLMFSFGSYLVRAQNKKPTTGEALIRMEMKASNNLAKKMRSVADSIDDERHVGTIWNEINIPEHSCFILGTLLGQHKYIQRVKVTHKPNFRLRTSKNAHVLRVLAISADNFSNVARNILGMSYDERVTEWNLDCVGKYSIPSGTWIGEGREKSFFRIRNKGKVLQILGAIESGFSDKIISAIKNNPDVETISLGSGGGSVYEALKAGRYIRALGLETTLWNNCYSACPLVFMGGMTRTVWSPYPSLGLHQVYTRDGAVPLTSKVYSDIYSYLMEMGVDSDYVVSNMWKAAPNKMNTLKTDTTLCKTKIATWVQRWCSSEDFE
ncbi:MAG: hypothetical protein KF881_06960 [Acidobacteria bacterium]|nr:hypothetical protein [Acidobacteriota bacterium]